MVNGRPRAAVGLDRHQPETGRGTENASAQSITHTPMGMIDHVTGVSAKSVDLDHTNHMRLFLANGEMQCPHGQYVRAAAQAAGLL